MAPLPLITLVRHGETEWSKSGRHTGRTDLPLDAAGRAAAEALASVLDRADYSLILTSPAIRARDTARLSGFADAEPDPDLWEWDYGAYEGLTTAEIKAQRPGWNLFGDGCLDGEQAADVGIRADRVIDCVRDSGRPAILFSSAHFLRVLGARWIGLDASDGARFALDTASISILGYDHGLDEPVIRHWNDSRA